MRDESTEARLRLAVRGNKPNATQLAKGADPRGEYDLSALARFAIQGDAIIGPDVRALLDAKDDEIWRLRVQVAHLQGDRVGTQGKRTFQPTSRKQSAARAPRPTVNRGARSRISRRTCTRYGRRSRRQTLNGGALRASRTWCSR